MAASYGCLLDTVFLLGKEGLLHTRQNKAGLS